MGTGLLQQRLDVVFEYFCEFAILATRVEVEKVLIF